MDPDGSHLTALTEPFSDASEPEWDRASGRIAFITTRDSMPQSPWVTARQERVTTAGRQEHDVVSSFAVAQNYPNPFNPTTVISGQWTVDSRIRLVVYDVLGQEVAVLADGRYPAGKYTFTFDGSHASSGVYFYRLTAGSFTAVRKMTLIR